MMKYENKQKILKKFILFYVVNENENFIWTFISRKLLISDNKNINSIVNNKN